MWIVAPDRTGDRVLWFSAPPSMHIFLSEYLTCGAVAGEPRALASLAIEGAAMVRAIAADAAAVRGWNVAVVWSAALDPFGVDGVGVQVVRTPAEERRLFEDLAARADRTFVIAPESDGLLEARCRMVMNCGGRWVGASPEAIALCGDKPALAKHLHHHGVPTIDTRPCDFAELADAVAEDAAAGFVVKPRHGAGAVDTFHIRSLEDLAETQAAWLRDDATDEPIVQPYIRGTALSIAAVVSSRGVELFPVCRQQMTDGLRLHYAGGRLSTIEPPDEPVLDLARRTLAAVPGLSGYVGIDLIRPDDRSLPPLVVEINPRLTSSYHGYRRLAATNLAKRILTPEIEREPVCWHRDHVDFDATGHTS